MPKHLTEVRFRPMDRWPGDLRRWRGPSRFGSSLGQTKNLLSREVEHLDGRLVVVEIATAPRNVRQDGYLSANFRQPDHPGVIVDFDSKHGSLRYWTDIYTHWEHNLRAVALGLEALRKVSRYGIGDSGEQYRGWAQLGSGIPMPAVMSIGEAAHIIGELAGNADWADDIEDDPELAKAIYHDAARLVHPDAGGDTAAFQRLTEAKRVLDVHHGGN